jgi:hypothetical protein
MTLSTSHYLTVNVPYVYLCLNTGLSSTTHCHPKTIPNSWHVACCLKTCQNSISESFHIIHWRRIDQRFLNGLTSRNPVDLNQVSVEARLLVILYLSTDQEAIQVPAGNETEMCGSAIMHEVQFSTNDQWHVGQEIRHVFFQESFVILPCKPVWMYGNRLRELRKSVYHSAVLESLNSETMDFRTYVDKNYLYCINLVYNPEVMPCISETPCIYIYIYIYIYI